jgi:hypothetical protein
MARAALTNSVQAGLSPATIAIGTPFSHLLNVMRGYNGFVDLPGILQRSSANCAVTQLQRLR